MLPHIERLSFLCVAAGRFLGLAWLTTVAKSQNSSAPDSTQCTAGLTLFAGHGTVTPPPRPSPRLSSTFSSCAQLFFFLLPFLSSPPSQPPSDNLASGVRIVDNQARLLPPAFDDTQSSEFLLASLHLACTQAPSSISFRRSNSALVFPVANEPLPRSDLCIQPSSPDSTLYHHPSALASSPFTIASTFILHQCLPLVLRRRRILSCRTVKSLLSGRQLRDNRLDSLVGTTSIARISFASRLKVVCRSHPQSFLRIATPNRVNYIIFSIHHHPPHLHTSVPYSAVGFSIAFPPCAQRNL